MKKMLSIMLTVVILMSCCLLNVTADAAEIMGTLEENTYTNEFFGFGCTVPDGWTLLTADEILEVYGITIDELDDYIMQIFDEIGTLRIMFTGNEETYASMNVICQIVDESVTEEIYAEYGQKQFSSILSDLGFEDGTVKKGTVEFMGKEHACIFISGKVDGNVDGEVEKVEAFQTQIPVRVGDFIVIFTVRTYLEDTAAESLQWFFEIAA